MNSKTFRVNIPKLVPNGSGKIRRIVQRIDRPKEDERVTAHTKSLLVEASEILPVGMMGRQVRAVR